MSVCLFPNSSVTTGLIELKFSGNIHLGGIEMVSRWIWPKIAQDISQICPRYVQALPEVWGFKLRKWDKMSPGRVHKLGHYVAGEVHNAVGHFVVGTFCLLIV